MAKNNVDGVYSDDPKKNKDAKKIGRISFDDLIKQDLKVTIQSLGWRDSGGFLPGMHDICSVAYWYQTIPAVPFPPLPDRDSLEII